MLEVVMCFESGEVCATAVVASMAEASVEAAEMFAYGHSPVLKNNGVTTHRWHDGQWAAVH